MTIITSSIADVRGGEAEGGGGNGVGNNTNTNNNDDDDNYVSVSIGGRMVSDEIETILDRAMQEQQQHQHQQNINGGVERKTKQNKNGSNTLNVTGIRLTNNVTEHLIRLIRKKSGWESIDIVDCYCEGATSSSSNNMTGNLIDDLLIACTSHPKIDTFKFVDTRTNVFANGGSAGMFLGMETSKPINVIPASNMVCYGLNYGLKYNTCLQSLRLGIGIDVNVSNLLARSLLRNTTLKELVLDNSTFLAETTATNNKSNSNDTDDDNNQYDDNLVAVQTLSFGLRFNRTITSLSLNSCHLEDNDVSTLLNAVNTDDTVLTSLSLRHNACNDKGMLSIAVLLQENVIKHLDMSYLQKRSRRDKEQKEEESKDVVEEKVQEEQQDQKEVKQKGGHEDDDNKNEMEKGVTSPSDKEDDKNPIKEGQEDTDSTPPKVATNDEQQSHEEDEETHQPVRNSSLISLSMMGNSLDDEYFKSLLRIFQPTTQTKLLSLSPCIRQQQYLQHSRLEELNMFGNRLSNTSLSKLLRSLSQFPNLERLYIGYQQLPLEPPPPPPVAGLRLLLNTKKVFNPALIVDDFTEAIVTKPNNYRLYEIDIVPMHIRNDQRCSSNNTKKKKKEDDDGTEHYHKLRRMLTYNTKLNFGGRRLLASYVATPVPPPAPPTIPPPSTTGTSNTPSPSPAAFAAVATMMADPITTAATSAAKVTTRVSVPIGLYPILFERSNRLYPLPSVSSRKNNKNKQTKNSDDDDDDDENNKNNDTTSATLATTTTTATTIATTADDEVVATLTATENDNDRDDDDDDDDDTTDDDGFHSGDVLFCLLRHVGPIII